MTRKSNETKTISLSLNFNNEKQYHFTVKLPLKTYTTEAWDLLGVNSAGARFTLGGLSKPLMRLLVQLDHATKRTQDDWYETEYWRIHAPPKKRRMVALLAEVSAVKEVEPSAEVSASAARAELPDANVIQVKFSPKAK